MTTEAIIDLDKKQLDLLLQIIQRHIPFKTVWAYGSRVQWKANPTSDLDLVVFDANSTQIFNLKQDLQDSELLISVDVLQWETIPDQFKTNIKRKYTILQQKPQQKGWREVKLGDMEIEIIDGDRGKNYPQKDDFLASGYCLFLNTKNVTENGFSFTETNFITEEKDALLRKGKLQLNDIVLTTRGTVGNVAFYTEKIPFQNIRINSGMVIIRPNGIDVDFNYQLFKSLKDTFLNFTSGSAQPQLPIRDLEQIPIYLPPIPEQKAIAEILSAFDDKIALLHRQNQTLETTAQTIFQKYFTHNPNKTNWEVVKFGEVVENFDSKRIPVAKADREKMKTGELYPYYGAAEIMDYVNDYIFDGEYILMAEDGTVKTDLGYPVLQYATGKFWVNNHTHVLSAKPPYNNHFIWHFLLNLNIEDIITGAVQPKINQTNLNSIKFPHPPVALVGNFQKQAQPLHEKSQKNATQIKTLKNLRDTLLPKLLSGKIKL